ncbi:MAG TPA: hypothetical protein VFO39_05600 [Candidatus Sulfotelmatobacter sp.]|nr:hypothetical protein [Candidatus Sulfotelmatobacter sp.]
MWIGEVAPERLAELFHNYHEALTTDLGKRSEKKDSWNHVPAPEKNRLVAAARLALLELRYSGNEQAESRQYYAKPGEAEWGC